MNTHKLVLVSIFIMLVSCEEKQSALNHLLKAQDNPQNDSLQLIPTDTISIPIKGEVEGQGKVVLYRPLVVNGEYLYAIVRSKPYNRIVSVSLSHGELVSEFALADPALRQEGITSFYVHSRDSLFFQTANAAQIILTDGLGQIRWTKETTSDHKYTFASFMPHHVGSYNSKDRSFYSTLIPVGFFEFADKRFDNFALQGRFSLDSNKWTTLYAPVAGVLKQMENAFYPPDLSIPYNFVLDDRSYVNYPIDHFVYVYDVPSGKLLFSKATTGATKVDLPEPLPVSLIKDMQETWNFRIMSPFYEPLLYHSAVGLFTRAIHLPQPLKTEDGRLNTGEKRQTAVIIMNRHLDVVGEMLFTGGEYAIHGATALPDGILLEATADSTKVQYTRLAFKRR